MEENSSTNPVDLSQSTTKQMFESPLAEQLPAERNCYRAVITVACFGIFRIK